MVSQSPIKPRRTSQAGTILHDGALRTVEYDDALPVRTTRAFLADPGRTVRTLLT